MEKSSLRSRGMNFNSLDYIFIALLLISALVGFRRGFIDTFGGMLSLGLGLLAAAVFYDDFAYYLERHYSLIDIIADFIRGNVILPSLFSLSENFGTVVPESTVATPDFYFANLLTLAGCFLLLLLSVSLFVKLGFKGLSSLLGWGVLGGINRLLGMVLETAKNLFIMAGLVGLLYPVVTAAAQIGLQGAAEIIKYTDESIIFDGFLNVFYLLRVMIGFNV